MAIKDITPQGRSYALIGGIVGLLAVVSVRFAMGSPWTVFHRLDAAAVLPPLWLLGLVWIALPVLCGLAAGALLGRLYGAAQAEAAFWRGCTFLVLSLLCALAWYILLFGKCSLFFSGLCLVAAAFAAFLCVLSWRAISVGCTLIVAANALWYVILFFMQLAVVLHN